MPLKKDTKGDIYTSITSDEQTELCDYVLINGKRFDVESDLVKEHRAKAAAVGYNGHSPNCSCFICNH